MAEQLNGFAVTDGRLRVGGWDLERLAARVGRTPFFAYDRALISGRVAELRAALPAGVEIKYAIKANPMAAVVQHLAGLVDGFDLASAGELKTALDTTMPPERISFAGPGKTPDELSQAVAAGITLNLESEAELEQAAALGAGQGVTPRVAVRVNPDFELKASGMRMGGGPKQFGIDAERVPEVLRRIGELGLDFQGFQIFSGSQNLRSDAITETQTKTVDLALALAQHAPGAVRVVNIGGGFGIPYFAKDQPLDLAAVGAGLAPLLPKVAERLPDAKVQIELGRYLVGEAGIYVSRVIDRKVSRGEVFLITDGGLHHQLAASGNFGQVVRRNYPVAVGTKIGVAETETASVVGCLCTPLDLLADKAELPRAEVGDLIVVFQSGAYGLTASPTAFLSHPEPAEVLV
ncbi:MAG: pyridoxal-dependent decarboxylase, exosortase A system-associated [Pseudomonadota bacterium]